MTRGFGVGVAELEAVSWPPAWQSYAEASFHAEHGRAPSLQVRYEGTTTGDPADTRVELTAEGLSLAAAPQLHGRFCAEEATLRLCAPIDDCSPRVNLENGLRLFLATWLPYRWGGLMLHAAAGALEGRGLAFAGISTAGKSTLANGFQETVYVSDDIAVVDGLDGLAAQPRLVGAPFFGVSGRRGADTAAPLAAIGLLAQAQERTTLRRLSPREAAAALLRHVVCVSHESAVLDAVLARVTELVAAVPVLEVARCLTDDADAVAGMLLEEASC